MRGGPGGRCLKNALSKTKVPSFFPPFYSSLLRKATGTSKIWSRYFFELLSWDSRREECSAHLWLWSDWLGLSSWLEVLPLRHSTCPLWFNRRRWRSQEAFWRRAIASPRLFRQASRPLFRSWNSSAYPMPL